MYVKLLLCFSFILYSIFLTTINLKSYFTSSLVPSDDNVVLLQCPPPERPLRVFIYDLPRKFHVAMLRNHWIYNPVLPLTMSNLPQWDMSRSDRGNGHSVEYWLMAALLYDDDEGEREVVRVSDPNTADVFFVPFFSSTSMRASRTPKGPNATTDRQLQGELVKLLHSSKYWQRSGGIDHVIPMTHHASFRFQRHLVNTSIFIVASYSTYPIGLVSSKKDVLSPLVHYVDSFSNDNSSDPFASRPTLLFFKGRTKDRWNIRSRLSIMLSGYNDVHYEEGSLTTQNIEVSTKYMRTSKFCLFSVGDTPTSSRLFDAIVSHCVPVIVSDYIDLPFEDEFDYSEFSIFFSIEEALLQHGYMINKLRQVTRSKWIEMWRRLKKISHHFEFQYPPKRYDAVDMIWRQVKHKLPDIQISMHQRRRSPKGGDGGSSNRDALSTKKQGGVTQDLKFLT